MSLGISEKCHVTGFRSATSIMRWFEQQCTAGSCHGSMAEPLADGRTRVRGACRPLQSMPAVYTVRFRSCHAVATISSQSTAKPRRSLADICLAHICLAHICLALADICHLWHISELPCLKTRPMSLFVACCPGDRPSAMFRAAASAYSYCHQWSRAKPVSSRHFAGSPCCQPSANRHTEAHPSSATQSATNGHGHTHVCNFLLAVMRMPLMRFAPPVLVA